MSMNTLIRHCFTQLLVAALVGLGIARAGSDYCPPDCGHCHAAAAVSPCCADMTDDAAGSAHANETQHVPGCGHGFYCVAYDISNEVAAGAQVNGWDTAPALSATVVFDRRSVPFCQDCLMSLKPPPYWRQPPLYTLICSLLI